MRKHDTVDLPQPNLANRALAFLHSWTIPLGVIFLIFFAYKLFDVSVQSMTILPAQTPYPMLQHSTVISNTVYFVQRDQTGKSAIGSLVVSSTPQANIVISSSKGSVLWPSPSPQNTQLAFFTVEGEKSSLWVLSANQGPIDVTFQSGASGLGNEYQVDIGQPPLWSPNGMWVAFLGQQIPARGNAVELFIAKSDGTGVRRLTDLKNIVSNPNWISNGEMVFATINTSDAFMIYRISIVQASSTPEPLTGALKMPK